MNSYYSSDELKEFGFKSIGANLKISKKASLYNCDLMEFGDNVRIDDFCVLSGKLVFGSHIHIAPFCLLAGGDEGIHFEDFASCAYCACIFTRSDDYSGDTLTNPTIPVEYRYKTTKKSIHIRKHAIVGTSAIIFPGAHIEEGCSVGAASLVMVPTKAWGVYFGVPAKRINERTKGLLEQEKVFLTR
jgi:acetyltransferase-like isoleucine patch superfamily enzyme